MKPGSLQEPRLPEPFPALSAAAERHLLVALNAADTLSRETALRLARDPSGWLHARDAAAARRAAGAHGGVIAAGRAVARTAADVYASERALARAAGARILTRHDAEFPADRLRDLELPPAVLYRRGRLPTAPAIAIVGSRRADPYGLEVAERFAGELAAAGLVVVSGLAIGIDAAAHRGALAAGGTTVAVLGCGVDVDYPRSNVRLRERIAGQGALVSELRMGTAPEARHFPVRNRIIAALAVGTLVVRATPRSGSLITARLTLDLGREVWAVPGNVTDRRSAGTNSLVRDGAHPVQRSRDILEGLPLAVQDRLRLADHPPAAGVATAAARVESELARRILERLPLGEPLAQDRLIRVVDRPADEVVAALLTLELDGRVRRYPGPAYCRRR